MKKRIVSIGLVLAMLFVTASAYATPRASLYLDSYLIQFYSNGNGSMTVSYGVYGTGKMAKIGAQKIVVEEQSPSGSWYTVETFSDGDYSYNKYQHDGSVEFIGLPSVTYRATLTAYAGNGTNGDSRQIESSAQVCK